MAATRFISMHTGKDKTPAASLTERIDYILNPAKTDGGKWVLTWRAMPCVADAHRPIRACSVIMPFGS